MKRALDDSSVTLGSGNVFADIGVPNPELALAKSQLAARIAQTIRDHGWTRKRAARKMGIDEPKVSAIIRGRVRALTLDRLVKLLARLGQPVTIRFGDMSNEASNGAPDPAAGLSARKTTLKKQSR
jgi:predicted XRE-type DNA-binding protein